VWRPAAYPPSVPANRRSTSVATVALGTAAASVAGALLHVGWACGSTFPFRARAQLNDAVIGRDATPSPALCLAVAAALGGAAVVVGRSGTGGGPVPRTGAAVVATVLTTRALFGFAGRTDLLVPGSESARFRQLDRRLFAPICALLGAGAATAALAGRRTT
jgi:Protein of unknown function (DUF3995)